MKAIMDEQRTVPCPNFDCHRGRVWKEGFKPANAIDAAIYRITFPEHYEAATEVCPVCQGTGEIESLTRKR